MNIFWIKITILFYLCFLLFFFYGLLNVLLLFDTRKNAYGIKIIYPEMQKIIIKQQQNRKKQNNSCCAMLNAYVELWKWFVIVKCENERKLCFFFFFYFVINVMMRFKLCDSNTCTLPSYEQNSRRKKIKIVLVFRYI